MYKFVLGVNLKGTFRKKISPKSAQITFKYTTKNCIFYIKQCCQKLHLHPILHHKLQQNLASSISCSPQFSQNFLVLTDFSSTTLQFCSADFSWTDWISTPPFSWSFTGLLFHLVNLLNRETISFHIWSRISHHPLILFHSIYKTYITSVFMVSILKYDYEI